MVLANAGFDVGGDEEDEEGDGDSEDEADTAPSSSLTIPATPKSRKRIMGKYLGILSAHTAHKGDGHAPTQTWDYT